MVGSLEPGSASSHVNDDLQEKENEPLWFLILKLGEKAICRRHKLDHLSKVLFFLDL